MPSELVIRVFDPRHDVFAFFEDSLQVAFRAGSEGARWVLLGDAEAALLLVGPLALLHCALVAGVLGFVLGFRHFDGGEVKLSWRIEERWLKEVAVRWMVASKLIGWMDASDAGRLLFWERCGRALGWGDFMWGS